MASAQEDLHALQARYDALQAECVDLRYQRDKYVIECRKTSEENADLRKLLADAVSNAAA